MLVLIKLMDEQGVLWMMHQITEMNYHCASSSRRRRRGCRDRSLRSEKIGKSNFLLVLCVENVIEKYFEKIFSNLVILFLKGGGNGIILL